MTVFYWIYSKYDSESYGYTYVDEELESMNFTNINPSYSNLGNIGVLVETPSTFIMPSHDVFVVGDMGRD